MFAMRNSLALIICSSLAICGCGEISKPTEVSFRPIDKPTWVPALPRGAAPSSPDIAHRWSRGFGEGKGRVELTMSPVKLSSIKSIRPVGMIEKGRVLPTEYVSIDCSTEGVPTEVVAPADGFIVLIIHTLPSPEGESGLIRVEKFRVMIEHSSTFWTVFDNLSSLHATVVTRLPDRTTEGEPWYARISVKKGDVIGTVCGSPLQVSTIDSTHTSKQPTVPKHYGSAPWIIHAVNPLHCFSRELRLRLQTKLANIATDGAANVLSDSLGGVAGNWFLENSDFVAGNEDGLLNGFGHLAFAPNPAGDGSMIVSVGNFEGRHAIFATDPAGGRIAQSLKAGQTALLVADELSDQRKPTGKKMAILLRRSDEATLEIELSAAAGSNDKQSFSGNKRTYTR